MKLMVVEDEKKVLNFIKKALSNAEFAVDSAYNLDEMFSNMLSAKYDVIVLDRMLGGIDAIKYVPDIKKKSPGTKIIVLSALSEVEDKVCGLSSGVDDYLGKPFHLSELIARVRALLRRTEDDHRKGNILTFKDLVVDLESQLVKRKDKKIELTPKEYKLLIYLMRKPNRIASKTELLNEVWELQHYPESNVLEVAINHLRGKVDKSHDQPLIHSKRGVGYWFGDNEL